MVLILVINLQLQLANPNVLLSAIFRTFTNMLVGYKLRAFAKTAFFYLCKLGTLGRKEENFRLNAHFAVATAIAKLACGKSWL